MDTPPPMPSPYEAMPSIFADVGFDAIFAITFIIMLAVVVYRLRAYRRINAMAARNASLIDDIAVRHRETVERQERMIAILGEIRDRLPRVSPTNP